MRALVCHEYGTPDRLRLEEWPAPRPGPHEISVAVSVAGLGYVDALHVAGRYQIKLPVPFVPASEVAGVVLETGSEVRHLQPGQRVFGLCVNGGLAEQVVLRADWCQPIPEALSDIQAACLPAAYGTSLFGLRRCGRLQPGETLLVLGAAGGLGIAAVDLGKAIGARVIAAASSEAKRALALKYGADAVIDYGREDWRNALKQTTGPRGVDVVFDPVGGAFAETAFRSIAPEGRYLVIGFAAGVASIPLNLPLLKRASIIGVNFGATLLDDSSQMAPVFNELVEWCGKGLIHPAPAMVYSLENASEALGAMLDRRVEGRVVVAIRR